MKTLRILSATAALGLFTAAAQPAAQQPPVEPGALPYGALTEEAVTNAPMQFNTNEVGSPDAPLPDRGATAVVIDPNTGLPIPLQVAPSEQPVPMVEPPLQPAPLPPAVRLQPSAPARRAAVPPPSPASEPTDLSAYAPPATASPSATGDLRLNFRNAPIEMVLNYLSDAAGFIIQLDTSVSGRVDIWSNQPVTRQEAVELLNSVLNRKGYAVVRNGRILKIMNRDEALHSDIPVNVSNEPDTIPKTDELVTQIIPIRYVEAKQLVTDLSPLISPRATIIANEAGNSIIITDTQANIRHAMEIIKAIDTSAEDFSEVRVFHLRYHDPVEVANLLTSLFSDQGQGTQSPIRFGGGQGGGGGGGQGGFGQGGGGGRFAQIMAAASANNRIRKRTRVVAVPDQRTASVVVTAAKDLMDQIGDMVEQIDRESPKVGRVSVIHLENADPQQLQQVLQDMFQSGNTARRGVSQNSPLMNRSQQGSQQTTSGTSFGNQSFGGGFGGGAGGGFRPGGQ